MLQNIKSKKITAWIAIVAVLFVMLLSYIYISQHMEHDCSGEDCPICAEMTSCVNIIKNIGTTVISIVATFCLCLSIKKSIRSITNVYSDCSLISQKVRMNN